MRQASDFETRLHQVEENLARLAGRVAALEEAHGTVSAPAAPVASADVASESAPPGFDTSWLAGVPSLAGRTCLVLGGAFLIRSLAESGTLSIPVAVGLGSAYALVWLFLADRAAAAGRSASGAFHALASALIVFPLAVEAATRFRVLAPAAAAAALALVTALGLVVAWRRAFRIVAWITVIAALAAGVVLLFETQAALPFVLYLLALGLGSLVLAYGRGWRGQRWLTALTLDALTLWLGLLWLVGSRRPEWLSLGTVVTAQLGLVALYLGAFVLRLLLQERDLTRFAVVQTIVVLAVGFEAAARALAGGARTALAAAALATGGLLHAVLARRAERLHGHGGAVGYFSSLAIFLVAEGVRGLLPAALVPTLWTAGAAVLAAIAAFGSRGGRPIFQLQAAVLAIAGALAGGVLAAARAALFAGAAGPWPGFSPARITAWLGVAATALLLYLSPRASDSRGAAVARVATILVALLGLGGLAADRLGAALAGAPGEGARAGALAVLRTAILAGAAVGLALARSRLARRELGALAWTVLLVASAKLLLEDLRVERAALLVASLALYGLALIAVPAILRRAAAASRSGES
ncbi:MAG: hypothetical protein U0X73_04630 [Thermoanaerobaculia bacterium]